MFLVMDEELSSLVKIGQLLRNLALVAELYHYTLSPGQRGSVRPFVFSNHNEVGLADEVGY
jgi:hypothetical protein